MSHVGEVDAADRDAARRSARRGAAAARATVLLPAPLAPTSATVSPGRELEVDAVEHERRPRRVGERDALEAARRRAPGSAATRAPPAPTAGGASSRSSIRSATASAVGARVELRAELAQRQVELGREHEHRQRRLEAEPAADEPHADRDRDERDAERRRQLEHRARRGSATRSVPIVARR